MGIAYIVGTKDNQYLTKKEVAKITRSIFLYAKKHKKDIEIIRHNKYNISILYKVHISLEFALHFESEFNEPNKVTILKRIAGKPEQNIILKDGHWGGRVYFFDTNQRHSKKDLSTYNDFIYIIKDTVPSKINAVKYLI